MIETTIIMDRHDGDQRTDLAAIVMTLIVAIVCALAGASSANDERDEWVTHIGAFDRIARFATDSRGKIYATGSSAVIAETNYGWKAIDGSITDKRFRNIAFVNNGIGWAVGDEIVARIKDGLIENAYALPGYYLTDVYLLSESSGWASGYLDSDGARGAIFVLKDNKWSLHTRLSDNNSFIYSIWGDGNGRLWAAGSNGIVLTLENGAWDMMKRPSNIDLYTGIYLNDDKIVVGGGTFHGPSGRGGKAVIYEYDGSDWKIKIELSTQAIVRMARFDESVIGLGASGVVYSRSSNEWIKTNVGIPTDYTLPAVELFVNANTSIGYIARSDGAIFQFDSLAGRVKQDGSNNPIFDIAFISTGDGWAVGQDVIYQIQRNGDIEISEALPGVLAIDSYRDEMDGNTIDRVWAVGRDGIAYEYTNTGWSRSIIYRGIDFFRVRIDANNRVWALGTSGAGNRSTDGPMILARYYGGNWEVVWRSEDVDVIIARDFAIASVDSVLLATNHGVIKIDKGIMYRTALNVPTYSIDIRGDKMIWVGGIGRLYRMKSTCWSEYKIAINGIVDRIYIENNELAWASAGGYIFRYGDGRWDPIRGPFDSTRVSMIPNEILGITSASSDSVDRLWVGGAQNSVISVASSLAERLPTVPIATRVRPPSIPTRIATSSPTQGASGRCVGVGTAYLPVLLTEP